MGRYTENREYEETWLWHIDQLAKLALAAKIDYPDYARVRDTLHGWVTAATVLHQQHLMSKDNE